MEPISISSESMSRNALLFSSVCLAFAVSVASQAAAQARSDLPPPDSSRPPLLTRLPPDSIRHQVRGLRLLELLGQLQRGEGPRVDATLAEVEWSGGDEASRQAPECRTPGNALHAAAGRVREAGYRESGSLAFPIFFDRVRLVDSAAIPMARATLVVLLPSGRRLSTAIELVMNGAEARWVRGTGLLQALCDVARGVER